MTLTNKEELRNVHSLSLSPSQQTWSRTPRRRTREGMLVEEMVEERMGVEGGGEKSVGGGRGGGEKSVGGVRGGGDKSVGQGRGGVGKSIGCSRGGQDRGGGKTSGVGKSGDKSSGCSVFFQVRKHKAPPSKKDGGKKI
eukprot:15366224-Ditylum_brightwellii.AAC.1